MTTWYIATTGNDTTGNGTSGNPYLTIGKCVSVGASGDTISVASGTYTWASVNFAGKAFTITAQTNGGPIFDGGGAQILWQDLGTAGQTRTFTVTGVEFKNAIPTASATYSIFCAMNGGGNSIWNFNNCIFRDIKVDGNGDAGGLFGQSVGGGSWINAICTNCLFDNIARKNPAYSTAAAIVHQRASVTAAGGFQFINCTFYFNQTGLDNLTNFITGQGTPSAATSLIIKNCPMYNAGTAFTFYGNSWSSGATVSYSACNGFTSPPTGTGVITLDPLLVDPANDIFRLKPSSPCRGAGTGV